jgi:hypothetical protein
MYNQLIWGYVTHTIQSNRRKATPRSLEMAEEMFIHKRVDYWLMAVVLIMVVC